MCNLEFYFSGRFDEGYEKNVAKPCHERAKYLISGVKEVVFFSSFEVKINI